MTTLLNLLKTSLDSFTSLRTEAIEDNYANRQAFLDQLEAYYLQNGLYSAAVNGAFRLGEWTEAMKSLRTSANRAVEFYVSKLEPGNIPEAMPILTDNERIIEPIQKVWLWSNFAQKKSLIIREFAIYGDMFIKSSVNADKTRVFHRYYKPEYVTDFEEDTRGNINYFRLDIPQGKETYTEIWTEEGYTTYLHNRGPGADVKYLGSPASQGTLAELGIDFIPVAHARFRDIGQLWGIGAFTHALDKMDEANRMATRLHQMLFRYNKPLWVAQANAVDGNGRPLPPPQIAGIGQTEVDIEDDTVISMPGTSSLSGLVPNINYAAALSILQDMVREIERDLPELAYANLKEQGNLSGVAVRELMADAVDKLLEARSNFEAALVKADKHALTLGTVNGIFRNIGAYDTGDYDHTFAEREVLGRTDEEKADLLASLTKSGIDLRLAMQMAGYPQEIVDQVQPPAPQPIVVQQAQPADDPVDTP